MIDEELQIVSHLTGVDPQEIQFSDNGFLSRGYIIDHGRIVFKFKKYPEISYQNEIKILNFVNSLELDVNLQKVGWISTNDSYLGIYGVLGKILKPLNITDAQCKDYGQQIGLFLKKLHAANFPEAEKLSVNEEVSAWQERFERSTDLLSQYFNNEEIKKMRNFISFTVPKKLTSLGEKMVFSHGDLGMGNIFIDNNDKIGIIDFSESVYLDEAADFMDMENDKLCAYTLDAYNADDTLRKKVAIRRAVHPMFVIGTYRNRPEAQIQYFVTKIRNWLDSIDKGFNPSQPHL